MVRAAFIRVAVLWTACLIIVSSTLLLNGQTSTDVESLAVWSSDGRSLAINVSDDLRVFRAEEREPLVLPVDQPVTAMAFSESGLLLTTWDIGQIVSVWDVTTGERTAQYSFAGGDGRVRFIQFIEQDQLVAFNYFDMTVFYGGKRSPKSILREGRSRSSKSNAEFTLQESFQTGIYRWAYPTSDAPEVTPIPGGVSYVEGGLVFSSDLSMLATTSYSSQNRTGFPVLFIRIRDVQTGQEVLQIGDVGYRLRNLMFHPTHNFSMISLSENGVVRFWNNIFNEDIDKSALTLLPGRIHAMTLTSDGGQIATGGIDGKVRIWETNTGVLLEIHDGQPANIVRLEFTSSGDIIAFGDPLSYPHSWDARTLMTIADFRPTPTPTPEISVSIPTLPPR